MVKIVCNFVPPFIRNALWAGDSSEHFCTPFHFEMPWGQGIFRFLVMLDWLLAWWDNGNIMLLLFYGKTLFLSSTLSTFKYFKLTYYNYYIIFSVWYMYGE